MGIENLSSIGGSFGTNGAKNNNAPDKTISDSGSLFNKLPKSDLSQNNSIDVASYAATTDKNGTPVVVDKQTGQMFMQQGGQWVPAKLK